MPTIEPTTGVDTIAIHYRSIGRHIVVEIIEIDAHGRGIRGCATHGARA